MEAFERSIMAKNPRLEYGQVFNADGTAYTAVTKGSKSAIRWSVKNSEGEWVGKTLTHFHPHHTGRVTAEADFVSLSSQDVSTFIHTKLGSLRAFSADGTWMEVVNNGYRYGPERFNMLFKSEIKKVERANAEEWSRLPVTEANEAWSTAYRDTLRSVIDRIDGISLREGKW